MSIFAKIALITPGHGASDKLRLAFLASCEFVFFAYVDYLFVHGSSSLSSQTYLTIQASVLLVMGLPT